MAIKLERNAEGGVPYTDFSFKVNERFCYSFASLSEIAFFTELFSA